MKTPTILTVAIFTAVGAANAQSLESRKDIGEKFTDDFKYNKEKFLAQPYSLLQNTNQAGKNISSSASEVRIPIFTNFGTGNIIPYLGPEVDTLTMYIDGKKEDVAWEALSPEIWRKQFNNQYTDYYILKNSNSVNASVPSIFSGSLEKGSYTIVYNNFIYKTYPCSPDDPGAGNLLVGVGVRIEARITSKSNGVSIGIPYLALGVSTRKIEGRIVGHNIGLGASPALNNAISQITGEISYEKLIAASNAYVVASAVLENKGFTTKPRIIGYTDSREAGSCFKTAAGPNLQIDTRTSSTQ